MDLTKLSDADLLALQQNDLTKLSDAGLSMLQGAKVPSTTNVGFGETGGGAATGRPMRNVQLNVQAQPRPAESVVAGLVKSLFVDPVLGTAKLASGGTLGQETAQRYEQEAEPYKKASPIGYGTGQLIGSVAPALGIAKGASMIPSFASSPLAQNVVAGSVMGALSPETTGKTGLDFYKEQAKEGAIGGAFGVIPTAAEKLGFMLRGKGQTPEMATAVQTARDLGYVMPPTQVNPSLLNRTIEGVSGKIATAQNASARNQAITNKLTAKSLGLPEDTVITGDVLKDLRSTAGKAYESIGGTGTVVPKQSYFQALDDIKQPFIKTQKDFPNQTPSPVLDLVDSLKSPQFDASSAVEKIKQLRTQADDAFRTGNTDVAKAAKKAAGIMEDALEDHLKTIGNPDLLKNFRDARQLIAKTYTVEKAANTVTGTVDAKKLAAQLQKGKPLSGELKDIAEFSARFPKATQTTEVMGSLPQFSPLDYMAGVGGTLATQNPALLAAAAGRPVLRELALSAPIQNRLVQQSPRPLSPLVRALMIQSGNTATGE